MTARINDEGWDTAFVEWLKGSHLSKSDAVMVLSVGGGNIEKNVSKTSAGNYALGRTEGSTFYVLYVGRSDTDVKSRLLSWAAEKTKYTKFKFSYADTIKEAFEKECQNYHDFGESEKLDNDIHPDRPKGTDWKCRRCNIFN